MIRSLKKTQRLAGILATVFFAAALVSAYVLYSLPSDLGLSSGYEGVLTRTYVVVAITLVTGGAALYVSLMGREEIIVYKTKTEETTETSAATAAEAARGGISMDAVAALTPGESIKQLCQQFLQVICDQLEAGQGAYYEAFESEGIRKVRLTAGYALAVGESSEVVYDFGEGLVGQSAAEGRTLYVDDIPEGYIKIVSGLGTASPRYLLIVPVVRGREVKGVIEIASFSAIADEERSFVEQAAALLIEKMPE
ncbi:MAG: GAF domain-containing protein [Cyclobacteriaceae bacterium]|jgi:methyl-accepting chemotaxis protein|nr:GAF domain-containing protein [Cyclobacteriaceae bacterium]